MDEMVKYAHDQFLKAAVGITDDLRRMADEVEREIVARERFGYGPNQLHQATAGAVVHTLSWGFANLNLSRLIDRASEADRLVGGSGQRFVIDADGKLTDLKANPEPD